MKKMRILHLALAMVMILTLLAGCSGGSKTIKIGAIDPLTGVQAIFGSDSLNGKKMAVAEINAAGGVLGKQIELISEDDGAQAAQSTTVATKLITKDKVVAIAGAHGSGNTLAVMEVLNQYGVPCVTPGSSSPKVTNSGNKWISRGIPDDSLQSRILIKYAKEHDSVTKIGILYANDDYGKGGYNAALVAAQMYGVQIVGAEAFAGDDQNFTPYITKLKDAGAEGVLVWCVYTPASLIFKQMKEMGWAPFRYASPGTNNPVVFELSGGAVDGVVNTTNYYSKDPDPYVQDWIARYKKLYNKEPSQTSAVAYDAIKVIAEAIARAKSTEPAAVQKEIRATKNFKSLKGMLSIKPETGDYLCEVRLVVANAATKTYDYINTVKE